MIKEARYVRLVVTTQATGPATVRLEPVYTADAYKRPPWWKRAMLWCVGWRRL